MGGPVCVQQVLRGDKGEKQKLQPQTSPGLLAVTRTLLWGPTRDRADLQISP